MVFPTRYPVLDTTTKLLTWVNIPLMERGEFVEDATTVTRKLSESFDAWKIFENSASTEIYRTSLVESTYAAINGRERIRASVDGSHIPCRIIVVRSINEATVIGIGTYMYV